MNLKFSTLRYLFFFLFPLSIISMNAQDISRDDGPEKERKPLKERLVFGGDVILSFSNQATALGATPLIGYKVSERYTAGVGVSYIYYGYSSFRDNRFGVQLFNRFRVTNELFVHGEFEHLTFTRKFDDKREPPFTRNFPAVLVGGGYRQQVGGNAAINFTVLYDVLQDENSLYNRPILRGGVSMGF